MKKLRLPSYLELVSTDTLTLHVVSRAHIPRGVLLYEEKPAYMAQEPIQLPQAVRHRIYDAKLGPEDAQTVAELVASIRGADWGGVAGGAPGGRMRISGALLPQAAGGGGGVQFQRPVNAANQARPVNVASEVRGVEGGGQREQQAVDRCIDVVVGDRGLKMSDAQEHQLAELKTNLRHVVGTWSNAMHFGSTTALLRVGSKFVHQCVNPDVLQVPDLYRQTMCYYSLRAIKPNKAMTMSYIGTAFHQLLPVQVRKQLLEEVYGFQCDCEDCLKQIIGSSGTVQYCSSQPLVQAEKKQQLPNQIQGMIDEQITFISGDEIPFEEENESNSGKATNNEIEAAAKPSVANSKPRESNQHIPEQQSNEQKWTNQAIQILDQIGGAFDSGRLGEIDLQSDFPKITTLKAALGEQHWLVAVSQYITLSKRLAQMINIEEENQSDDKEQDYAEDRRQALLDKNRILSAKHKKQFQDSADEFDLLDDLVLQQQTPTETLQKYNSVSKQQLSQFKLRFKDVLAETNKLLEWCETSGIKRSDVALFSVLLQITDLCSEYPDLPFRKDFDKVLKVYDIVGAVGKELGLINSYSFKRERQKIQMHIDAQKKLALG